MELRTPKLSVKEAISSPRWWGEWIGIFLGCTILACGFVFFINPYNIVPGGVYGASIVLHNLFPSIQVGTFGYCFDIPLLLISVLFLGSKLGSRTIVAALSTPSIMNFITWLAFPNQEALEALDPAQIAGGCLNLSDDLLLATIIGAALIGIGCGVIVNCRATSGGTDIVAMLMQKYLKIPFSTGILIADGAVVAFGLLVIGFGIGSDAPVGENSCLLSLYSLLAIIISSRVIARVLAGVKDDKLLFIISDKPSEALSAFILNDLERTATRIQSRGLYTNGEKEMLFLVVHNKEVPAVKEAIRLADPRAFVVVTDAYDTYGEGWKQLPKEGELNPE